MSNVTAWDPVASNNSDAPPDGAPENTTLVKDLNNIIRENMAAVARMVRDTNGSLVSAGAGNAYTLATNNVYQDFTNILQLSFRADRANTGTATLAVDGLAAKPLRALIGVELDANAIPENGIVTVAYNPTLDFFHYLNPPLGPPVGAVVAWPAAGVPTGWRLCNGAVLDSVTNPELARLFAVIGTTYGGTGASAFNLPDYRGEFLRGENSGSGNDPDAASRTDRGDGTTGSNVGTKQSDEFESHPHASGSFSAASHSHALDVSTRDFSTSGSNDGGRLSRANTGGTARTDEIGPTGNSGSLNVSGTSSPAGGNETRPRNVYVQYIIKI